MENRRENYRHYFETDEKPYVEIAPGRRGDVENLSVSGIGVRLEASAACPAPEERVQLTLSLSKERPMTLTAVVVHAAHKSTYLGLRFLPLADARATESRERVFSSYLIDLQRHRRRQELDAARKAS